VNSKKRNRLRRVGRRIERLLKEVRCDRGRPMFSTQGSRVGPAEKMRIIGEARSHVRLQQPQAPARLFGAHCGSEYRPTSRQGYSLP